MLIGLFRFGTTVASIVRRRARVEKADERVVRRWERWGEKKAQAIADRGAVIAQMREEMLHLERL